MATTAALCDRNMPTIGLSMSAGGHNFLDRANSLTRMASDFASVIGRIHELGAPKIHVVAHSIGAVTLLQAAEQDATRGVLGNVVLWDPTHPEALREDHPGSEMRADNLGYTILTGGGGTVMRTSLYREAARLPNAIHLAENLGSLMVLSAHDGGMVDQGKAYAYTAQGPSLHEVLDAPHAFNNGTFRLLDEVAIPTADWITGRHQLQQSKS